mgnify:CR=1 FL=1
MGRGFPDERVSLNEVTHSQSLQDGNDTKFMLLWKNSSKEISNSLLNANKNSMFYQHVTSEIRDIYRSNQHDIVIKVALKKGTLKNGAIVLKQYIPHLLFLCIVTSFVEGSSQAIPHMRNSAMDDSIGGS